MHWKTHVSLQSTKPYLHLEEQGRVAHLWAESALQHTKERMRHIHPSKGGVEILISKVTRVIELRGADEFYQERQNHRKWWNNFFKIIFEGGIKICIFLNVND